METKMKRFGFMIGSALLAMALVFTFALVSCDNGTTSGGGGGPQSVTYTGTKDSVAYTLKITENLNRSVYTPVVGDTYGLTFGDKISAGTVSSFVGGTYTLKPDDYMTTFTATVSGNSLTALSGTITCTDTTTIAGPGALTGGGSGVIFTGAGTSVSPYKIGTAAQLAKLAEFVNANDTNYNNKYYILTDNIDLSSYDSEYNGGKGWIPIGGQIDGNNRYFLGTFDGDNKNITNLYINDLASSYKGLFGNVNGATIENLAVEDANVTGKDTVGILAGNVSGGSIRNCHSSGTVKSANQTGGLVGYISTSAELSNCYSTAAVTGDSSGGDIGGLAGFASSCTFTNCYASGTVVGGTWVGGLAGEAKLHSVISNCYATGSVSGSSYTGGLVGAVNMSITAGIVPISSISRCYATGAVNGTNYVGGIAGSLGADGTIEYCAAFNPNVTFSGTSFGRIAGSVNATNTIFAFNVAFDGMVAVGGTFPSGDQNDKNGLNMTSESIRGSGTIGSRFTGANGWTTANGKLPGLFGNTVDMPVHLAE